MACKPVLIVSAHKKEAEPLARSLGPVRSGPLPFRYSVGRYLFYLCGMGPDNSARSLRTLDLSSFKAAILFGTAGSLDEDYQIGSVLECAWVRTRDGEYISAPISFGLPRVSVVSVSQPVIKSDERESLCEETAALLVDMESASFVTAMEKASIPWGNIRMISDTPKDPPDFHFDQEIDTLLGDAAILAAEAIEEVFRDY